MYLVLGIHSKLGSTPKGLKRESHFYRVEAVVLSVSENHRIGRKKEKGDRIGGTKREREGKGD
jgi:hypothetical protein